MKIIRNLPGLYILFKDAKYANRNLKKIDNARESGDFEEERRLILDSTAVFGSMFMEHFKIDYNLHGEENIPDKGPVVIVANHQGYADIPALFAAFNKFQFGFIAKKELGKIPIYGPWMLRIRSIFMDRDDPRASLQTIREGIDYIKKGFSLVIFPEGTRAKSSKPGEFMKGSLKLATKAGVPIIPVTIDGTYRFFEDKGYMVKGTRFDVTVHKPVPTEGITREEEKFLADKIRDIIASALPRDLVVTDITESK
ncbi:MAG: lysophospholipid acyltransferase family protein [Firmicutes bacterium]|nr:lysophospholipid acyltransferase family protein [Bacillota bacterium]